MSPASPPRPHRKPARTTREPLSRERIAQVALELIDDEGLENCSMRRLGARLGVEAMALYHHFPAKGQLLDAVVDRLLDEMDLPPRDAEPPLERLRRAIVSWRAAATRHPPAYVLLAARRFNTERAFAWYEQVLEAFADLGLDAQQSARWFRLLGNYASGSGMAEVASRERVPDATALILQRDPQRVAFRHVRAVAPHLQVERLDEVFTFGLDVLFHALQQQVQAPPARPARAAGR